jgi:hypothetical protein
MATTSAATFSFTGVQLEVGSQATSFDFRDYGRELMLCQRYYLSGGNYAVYNGTAYTTVSFPTTMRASPTVTPTLGVVNSAVTNGFGASHTTTATFSYTASIEL